MCFHYIFLQWRINSIFWRCARQNPHLMDCSPFKATRLSSQDQTLSKAIGSNFWWFKLKMDKGALVLTPSHAGCEISWSASSKCQYISQDPSNLFHTMIYLWHHIIFMTKAVLQISRGKNKVFMAWELFLINIFVYIPYIFHIFPGWSWW